MMCSCRRWLAGFWVSMCSWNVVTQITRMLLDSRFGKRILRRILRGTTRVGVRVSSYSSDRLGNEVGRCALSRRSGDERAFGGGMHRCNFVVRLHRLSASGFNAQQTWWCRVMQSTKTGPVYFRLLASNVNLVRMKCVEWRVLGATSRKSAIYTEPQHESVFVRYQSGNIERVDALRMEQGVHPQSRGLDLPKIWERYG